MRKVGLASDYFKPDRTMDEIRTSAVKAMRAMLEGADPYSVEETLQALLTEAHQAGQIEANNRQIDQNYKLLGRQP